MVNCKTALKLKDKGLIFAPDLISFEKTKKIINECSSFFSAIKIGNTSLYRYGIGIVKKLKDNFNLPIICDFKLMDIPDIAEEVISLGIKNGMDGAMIWGVAGVETIQHCISKFPDVMIFVLTEYTHTSEIIDENMSNRIASEAKELGAYGIQAPATKPQRIKKLREIVGEDIKIISCGVGRQGPVFGTAISYGADYEIVGRSIYQAVNPALVAQNAYHAIFKF